MTTIVEGLAVAGAAIDLIKGLRGVERDFDQAELRFKMSELYVNLSELKMALSDAQIELRDKDLQIEELKSSMAFSEKLVEVDGFKYRSDEDGRPKGKPFCPTCEQNTGKFFQIHVGDRRGEILCPNCRFPYDFNLKVF